MRNIIKRIVICFTLAALVWTFGLLADRQKLRQELVRLHVVAASDDPADQQVKLRVRDAVLESLAEDLRDLTDPEQAKAYLRTQLPRLTQVAEDTLNSLGSSETVSVSLDTEAFPQREYDTFTLPSGVYDTLRITIGQGQGQNWWCVVFPELCLAATSEDFSDTAACAGFSQSLTGALTEQEGYELRFFLLDALGSLENFFHQE